MGSHQPRRITAIFELDLHFVPTTHVKSFMYASPTASTLSRQRDFAELVGTSKHTNTCQNTRHRIYGGPLEDMSPELVFGLLNTHTDTQTR